MKKLLLILLSLICAFTLFACDGGNDDEIPEFPEGGIEGPIVDY